jgi:outer membrane protein TolC
MSSPAAAISLGLVLMTGCSTSQVARAVSRAAPKTAVASASPADRARSSSKIRLASAEEVDATIAAEPISAPPASERSAGREPVPFSVGELSLERAIETGFNQNPDLVAFRQAEGVSIGAYGVAATYPFNPYVQVQATPIQHKVEGNGKAQGTVYNYVLLIQQIQLAHQQQFREDVASAQLNQVRWNIHQVELTTLAQTTRLYFTALYQRGIRDLTRVNADLNQQLLAISERQLEAGQLTEADVAIVRIDARSTKQQAELAEALWQAALLELRRQLNLPLDQPLELVGDLTQFDWKAVDDAALAQLASADQQLRLESFDDREVVRRLARGRPDVMAAHAGLAVGYSSYQLANAMRTQDLQIGPYYQRTESGTYYYGFRAQMDLPIWNNFMPLVRQRTAEYQQQSVTWQQLKARAEIEAATAADRYERARGLVAASRHEYQEELPTELEKLEEQFKAGEVDVLRIFQARTSLIQNRRAYLDMLNELAQSAALVTQATGLPPLGALAAPSPER